MSCHLVAMFSYALHGQWLAKLSRQFIRGTSELIIFNTEPMLYTPLTPPAQMAVGSNSHADGIIPVLRMASWQSFRVHKSCSTCKWWSNVLIHFHDKILLLQQLSDLLQSVGKGAANCILLSPSHGNTGILLVAVTVYEKNSIHAGGFSHYKKFYKPLLYFGEADCV